MEKAYSYNCTFDPDMNTYFSIEFCTSDEATYLKVKKVIDMFLNGDLNIEDPEYDDGFIVER